MRASDWGTEDDQVAGEDLAVRYTIKVTARVGAQNATDAKRMAADVNADHGKAFLFTVAKQAELPASRFKMAMVAHAVMPALRRKRFGITMSPTPRPTPPPVSPTPAPTLWPTPTPAAGGMPSSALPSSALPSADQFSPAHGMVLDLRHEHASFH